MGRRRDVTKQRTSWIWFAKKATVLSRNFLASGIASLVRVSACVCTLLFPKKLWSWSNCTYTIVYAFTCQHVLLQCCSTTDQKVAVSSNEMSQRRVEKGRVCTGCAGSSFRKAAQPHSLPARNSSRLSLICSANRLKSLESLNVSTLAQAAQHYIIPCHVILCLASMLLTKTCTNSKSVYAFGKTFDKLFCCRRSKTT